MGSMTEYADLECAVVECDTFGDGLGPWRAVQAGACGCRIAGRAPASPMVIDNPYGDL